MLWLCLHFPVLSLSALGIDAQDVAVIDQRGSHRWLINRVPEIEAGTPLSKALAFRPELKTQARKPAAEEAALRSLAWWAYRYGQPVTAEIQDPAEPGRAPRALLWVEIGASLALFRHSREIASDSTDWIFASIETLRERMCGELIELGHAAQIGIAPTRAGSALLACAGRSDPVLNMGELRERLSGLPLSILHWPGEILTVLRGIGLRHLGEVLALPRDGFVKRFGADRRLELDRLLGLAAEPGQSMVPPEIFCRRFELIGEVEDTESLLFPLRRLCSELQAYLRTRDCGVLSASLAVRHASARETRFTARFIDAHRDARRIFDALHERLDRDGLPLPARELLLIAEDFAEAQIPQSDLFDTHAGQAQAWSAAIERIRGRLGDEKLWIPETTEDHRPERAMKKSVEVKAQANCGQTPIHTRPAFLCPEPWPMPAPQLPADANFERIESGWWDQSDIRRDYMTLDIDGTRTWVFRDLNSGAWFMHGWWS